MKRGERKSRGQKETASVRVELGLREGAERKGKERKVLSDERQEEAEASKTNHQ